MAGLQGADVVLVLGNPALIPWLTEGVPRDNVHEARRPAEVEALMRDNCSFTKVIIGRETPFSNDHILRAAALMPPGSGGGLLVYFPTGTSAAWQFREAFEFYYPEGNIWEVDSTFGPMVMAEPRGYSWRMVHG